MAQTAAGLLRIVAGIALISFGLWALYKGINLWWNDWHWAGKTGASVGLILLVMPLAVDNGLGLALPAKTTVTPVTADAEPGAPDRRFLLIPGYNGRGKHMLAALRGHLTPHGSVVSFQYSTEGYDNEALLDAIEDDFDAHPDTEYVVLGESYGGMVIADVLRRNPDLELQGLVLNASPSRTSDVQLGGNLLKLVAWMHGGPITTYILQKQQAKDVLKAPTPEAGVDPAAVQAAHDDSLDLTAPMALGQLRVMAYFDPVFPDEFEDRVNVVRFVHAPGDSDGLINNAAASPEWEEAFTGADFADVSITEWDSHTPTPERPSPLAAQLLATVS